MTDTITATIRYVQRDASRDPTEKPYILHYTAPKDFPQNNFTIKPVHGIKVHNLRTAGISYEEHGMKIASLDSTCQMRPEDFDNDDWVESVYLPELHRCICQALGARDMTVFDWMLRKRAPSFPVRKGGEENEEAHQPSLSAHIDYTTAELESRLDRYFGEEKEAMLGRRYQVINIWKPLTGPCRDFPMAYLDPQSVNVQKDLIAVDEVFPTVANEVFQVCWNPHHKWYYVPDQLDSEITIFNAFDSEKGQSLAVPHCSFDLGQQGSGIPRQSIEVRAFVFY
ncbi:Methyltransferase [Madurella fahalii]|uniref:Methyltransferase n=1 Tax=Madurella fahalii TaxID=1157608 RepID=A0ABQ0G9W5_9PEZI